MKFSRKIKPVLKYLWSHKLPVSAIAIFILLGIVWLSRSNAATAFLSTEPENGTLTGAVKVTASDASGGCCS